VAEYEMREGDIGLSDRGGKKAAQMRRFLSGSARSGQSFSSDRARRGRIREGPTLSSLVGYQERGDALRGQGLWREKIGETPMN